MAVDPSRRLPAPRPFAAVALLVAVGLAGCEVDSFLDPSVVGRWERTPVVLPILDQLDVIDEPTSTPPGLSQVEPADLIADVREYVIGPGDVLVISIFELLQPNLESQQLRRVDALGMIRLPVVGPVKAEGRSASQLEQVIKTTLRERGILQDATVSALVQEGRQNQYSVIGSPRVAGTAIGVYNILDNDFRLMDAMTVARGVQGSIKKLYVIRQVPLQANVFPTDAGQPKAQPAGPTEPPKDPAKLIDDLLQGIEPPPDDGQPDAPGDADPPGGADAGGAPFAQVNAAPVAGDDVLGSALAAALEQPDDPAPAAAPAPPSPLEGGLQEPAGSRWVNVDGKWVRLEPGAAEPKGDAPAGGRRDEPVITQRVIEVPYDKLLEGDMRYNIVIRPGDIIRVPPPVIGNVYIGGAITRPGTFQLPGDRDLTLKQLVFAAGNLSPLAIPERVDLIRRVDKDREATVRIDLRAIFDGRQPDFFLKPNDTINVGTNFFAPPLAVVRNGFRASYGFGFIFDRNFAFDVFGPINR